MRKTFIRQKTVTVELGQDPIDLFKLGVVADIAREFARKLGTTVVAPSQ